MCICSLWQAALLTSSFVWLRLALSPCCVCFQKWHHAVHAEHPVHLQVTLCEQLTSYLTRFKPAAQSTASTSSTATVEVPQGMQVFKKKGVSKSIIEPLILLLLHDCAARHHISAFRCLYWDNITAIACDLYVAKHVDLFDDTLHVNNNRCPPSSSFFLKACCRQPRICGVQFLQCSAASWMLRGKL